jgi:DNA-binding transcriptional MerR regulator
MPKPHVRHQLIRPSSDLIGGRLHPFLGPAPPQPINSGCHKIDKIDQGTARDPPAFLGYTLVFILLVMCIGINSKHILHIEKARYNFMLSIGDFSRLGQVTVRTLRHYDELGLFKPAHIDPFTGYRYYTIDQLLHLNRILMLKDLGFTLEQIAHLLNDHLSAAYIHAMLIAKQAELQRELDESRVRLERVEARLRQLAQEGDLPNYAVIVKTVEPIKICSVRQLVPSIMVMPHYRTELFGQLYGWLAERGIASHGSELAIYHNAEYTETNIDMEAAIIADAASAERCKPAVTTRTGIAMRELPGAQNMASVIHQGQPKDVGQAMIALYTWIAENHLATNGPYRELHLYGRELDLKTREPVTIEIQIPVTTTIK